MGRRVLALGIGLVLLVLVGVTGSKAGDVGPCEGFDIIPFELAGSAHDARTMLAECPQPPGPSIDAIRDALDADSLLFVPAYVATLAWFCLARARLAPPSTPRGLLVLRVAVGAAVVAGLCDLVENAALHRVLDDPFDPGAGPAMAFAFAATKFALVAFAIVVAVVSLIALVRSLWHEPRPAG